MEIAKYFQDDDGSLPEVEVRFADCRRVVSGFSYLLSIGGREVQAGGTEVGLGHAQQGKPVKGLRDVELMCEGLAEPFHVVLGSITHAGQQIPDIGVFAWPEGLLLDYRMGSNWTNEAISAFLAVLNELRRRGGIVSAEAWWGSEGGEVFSRSLVNPGAP